MIWYPKLKKIKKNHLIKPSSISVSKKSKLNINAYYTYGIITLENSYLYNNQIECIRKSLVRVLRLKRLQGIYTAFRFRIYPHVSITKKAKGVRMGNGKGSHYIWSAAISKGKILLEFEGLNNFWALYLFNEINNRLPIKTKLIYLI